MGNVIMFPPPSGEDGEPVLTCEECDSQEWVVACWGATCAECGQGIEWKEVHEAFVSAQP